MKETRQRYKTPQDVYARHLISHRGYPLWIPELKVQVPKDYQDDGLKIGDVGYVVPEKGCFEVLFNICLPLDHDLHRGKRLPRDFLPVPPDEVDIATHTDVEDHGCVLSTSSVKVIKATSVEQPSDYRFTLSSSEGALLILPEGADQHLLQSDRLFGEYAKQHAPEWYRFVEEDLKRTISYDSLYVLTGFFKAPSFALASFQESEGSGDMPVEFKVIPSKEGCIVRGYRWSTAWTLDKRVGPKRYNGKANQAVYISGFKIAVRPEPAGKKRISVKTEHPSDQLRHEEFTDTVDSHSPDEDKCNKSSDTTQGGSGTERTNGHISLQRIPQVLQPFHPSDAINRYLLEKEPSAVVAITHDNQWAALLKNTQGRLELHELLDECLLVEALSEEYIITSRKGSVFLQSATGATQDLSTSVPSGTGAQDQTVMVDSTERLETAIARLALPSSSGLSAGRDEVFFHPSLEPPDLTSGIVKVPNRCQEGGTFGDIYKCQYNGRSGPEEVALKVFRFKLSPKDQVNYRLVKRRRRELDIWSRLRHGNIVSLLGIARGFGREGISLISPWMQNGCLHQFLERCDEELTIAHRLQLLVDIADGLHYLHTFHPFPIVHGNLNPDNILIDDHFTARLAGFGSSSFVGNLPESLAYLKKVEGRPSAVRWASPELLLEPSGTYQTITGCDIYSFGCVTMQTLAGKQPWCEVKEDATVILRLSRGQRPCRSDSQYPDEHQWEFIQRCWTATEDRPSSEMVGRTIRRFLSDHPLPRSLHETFGPLSDDRAISSSSSTAKSPSGSAADGSQPPSFLDI